MSPQPYKPMFLEPKPYSFDLNIDMVELLSEEFDAAQPVGRFTENRGDAEGVFGGYGRALAKRIVELGEEYPDRTYEVIKAMLDRTGGAYRFPLLPQRTLEIAYLSTQEFVTLPIMVNNPSQITYKVVDCVIHKGIRKQCGESTAAEMPCRHVCLGLCEESCQGFGITAKVVMEASMAKQGYCQFTLRPGR